MYLVSSVPATVHIHFDTGLHKLAERWKYSIHDMAPSPTAEITHFTQSETDYKKYFDVHFDTWLCLYVNTHPNTVNNVKPLSWPEKPGGKVLVIYHPFSLNTISFFVWKVIRDILVQFRSNNDFAR